MRLAALALLLVACGGGKPAWVDQQKDLLDTEEVSTREASEKVKHPPVRAANELDENEAATGRCVGISPDGASALVIVENRLRTPEGDRITLHAKVLGAAKEGLQAMDLANYDPSQSEDSLLGDGLQQAVKGKLPELNAQVGGLMGCLDARKAEAGKGGFRRKIPELMVYPKDVPTRLSIRDGALYLAPEGKAARPLKQLGEEAEKWRIAGAWFLPTANAVVVMINKSSALEQLNEAIFVGDAIR